MKRFINYFSQKKSRTCGCQTWGGCKRCSFTFYKFFIAEQI